MLEGVRMTAWEDNSRKVYMMGNPFVWWIGAFSIVCYLVFWLFHDIAQARGIGFLTRREHQHFNFWGSIFVGGYFLHLIPYFVMDRVTYLHHYLPCLVRQAFLKRKKRTLTLINFNNKIK